MDKKCTSCGKTVYPLEQLKCLDQIWHKQCFKCEVCGMTLNMKNYKGLEKKPYCPAHYPQPKAYTFVSDNPEMQRVKQNTAVISNIKYHEEFEKSKGTKMAVTEDMLQPPVAVKKAAAPTTQPSSAPIAIRLRRGSGDEAASAAAASNFDPNAAKRGSTIYSSEAAQNPVSSAYTGQSTVYTSSIGRRQTRNPSPDPEEDREADNHRGGGRYGSGGGASAAAAPAPVSAGARYSQASDYSSPRHSGYTPEPAAPLAPRAASPPVAAAPAPVAVPPAAVTASTPPPTDEPEPAVSAAASRGQCYRALYDYVAQDDDEISFNEGDVITNGDPIDDGWMYGIVERTGQYGMLPSNYVEELL